MGGRIQLARPGGATVERVDDDPAPAVRARNKVRTAPLWGVRLRPRLMHDGASLTLRDAILRHREEAGAVTRRFPAALAERPASHH